MKFELKRWQSTVGKYIPDILDLLSSNSFEKLAKAVYPHVRPRPGSRPCSCPHPQSIQ